jgi:hypothetical protein
MSLENLGTIAAGINAITGGAAGAAQTQATTTQSTAGQADAQSAQPSQAQTTQAAAAQSAVSQPQMVTIPIEQWESMRVVSERLVKLEGEQQRRDAAAREEAVKALAAKGQVEEALRQQRDDSQRAIEQERLQRAQTEERAKRFALDAELARAFAAQPLVTGGAEQLTQLLRDQFVVESAGNSFQVRSSDFRAVGDYVAMMLGRPEYRHFLRTHQAASNGSATESSATQPVEPKNFSDAVLMQFAATKKQTADPRLTPGVAFGLRPGGAAANKS